MITPAIFNEKIFNDSELFKARMQGDDRNIDDRYRGPMEILVSMFDYILAWKMDLIPTNNETEGISIFYDWLDYRTLSVNSEKEFDKILGESKTVEKLLATVPVHSDLFYAVELNPSDFYTAICMFPKPYTICCMQWGAYQTIYLTLNERTRVRGFRSWANPNRKTLDGCGQPNRFTQCDTQFMDSKFMDSNNAYDILCVQDFNSIDPEDLKSCINNINAYLMFTSDIGIRDCRRGDVIIGDYSFASYVIGRNIWTPDIVLMHHPSVWPEVRDGMTFYSDILQ